MRISTNLYFNKTTEQMTRQQSELVKLQGQLSTGLRVLKPSDDPLAMSTAIGARAEVSRIDSFGSNISYVTNQLSLQEDAFAAAAEVMQGLKERMIQGSNSTFSVSDRATIIQELTARKEELLGIANRQDTSGNFLFSGTREDQPAFSLVDPNDPTQGYEYTGGSRGKSIQITEGRSIDLDVRGEEAFTNPATGENIFNLIDSAIADLQAGDIATFRSRLSETDQTYDALLLGRTRVGLKLREVETVDVINKSASAELELVAGKAVGLDYAKAISELAQGQLQLQASQQSFSSTSRLSLFNYLG